MFLLNEGTYRSSAEGLTVGSRIVLVGIISSTMVRHQRLPIEVANAEHVKIAQELNLGVAFNARAIKETVEAFVAAAGQRLKASDAGAPVAVDPVSQEPTPLA
ncbi:hypothetical protein ACWCRF_09275 [Streptomyces sp. NPDC002405]